MDFKDKVIIITGASSGIGYWMARLLAKENCKLVLLARRKDKLDEIAAELSQLPSEIITIKCDVADRDEVVSAFAEAFKSFGRIDIAVLNAGVSHRNSVKRFNINAGIETIETNLLGIMYCVEALLPEYIKSGSGIIAGVSSLADVRGFPQSGFYSASKAAATRYLESLRVELRPYNISVLTVRPGFVKTPMTDKNDFYMPFLMEPEKAAKIILRGILKRKRLIQFPLRLVLLTKLLSVIPDSLFEYFASAHNRKKGKKL